MFKTIAVAMMRWHEVEVDVAVLNILRMNNVIYLFSFFEFERSSCREHTGFTI